MSQDYASTTEEMKEILLRHYGKIPEGNMEAYKLLREKAGLNNKKDINYDEKVKRHKNICDLLGFSPEGGLAGRDINDF